MKRKKILIPIILGVVIFTVGCNKINNEELNILTDDTQVVETKKNTKKEIDIMINNIIFNKEQEEDGYKNYSTVVENTTSMNFDALYLHVKLIDINGITIETTTFGAENWNSGDKFRFDFSTDKDFEKIELEYEYYN